MASRSHDICSIELGKEAISIVQYSPDENTIAGVAIKPIEETGRNWWENVQSELKALAGKMKLNGQDIICSLPSENAVIKRLILDKSERAVEESLRWEVGQQIIGSIDEYALDFQRTPVADSGPVEHYLVAAYHTGTIDRVSAMLRSHKMNPLVVDLDIFALVNVFEMNYRDRIQSPALLVLGGEEFTKVVLTCNGAFIDYEFFKNDSESLEPPAYGAMVNKSIQKLAAVNTGLMSPQTPPVYVAGSLFAQEDFAAQSIAALNQAELLYPFKAVSCRALADSDLQRYSPQLAVAIGLALRGTAEPKP